MQFLTDFCDFSRFWSIYFHICTNIGTYNVYGHLRQCRNIGGVKGGSPKGAEGAEVIGMQILGAEGAREKNGTPKASPRDFLAPKAPKFLATLGAEGAKWFTVVLVYMQEMHMFKSKRTVMGDCVFGPFL